MKIKFSIEDFKGFCPMDTGTFSADNARDAFNMARRWARKHGAKGPLRVELFSSEGYKLLSDVSGDLSALVTRSSRNQNIV